MMLVLASESRVHQKRLISIEKAFVHLTRRGGDRMTFTVITVNEEGVEYEMDSRDYFEDVALCIESIFREDPEQLIEGMSHNAEPMPLGRYRVFRRRL